MLELANTVLDALDNCSTIALATVIEVRGQSTIGLGAKFVVQKDGATLRSVGNERIDRVIVSHCERQIREGIETDVVTCDVPAEDAAAPMTQLDVYIEVMYGQPTMLIVGAGHIGWYLSKLAKTLRYRVVVVDDRPDFANRDRFPEADDVIAADVLATLSSVAINPSTYVVLVPAGHGLAEKALSRVIDSPARYIGVIGSRARAATIISNLREAGVPQERIARVYTPVGLKIGAQTPEEIALSILAEVVSVRQGGATAVKEKSHV